MVWAVCHVKLGAAATTAAAELGFSDTVKRHRHRRQRLAGLATKGGRDTAASARPQRQIKIQILCVKPFLRYLTLSVRDRNLEGAVRRKLSRIFDGNGDGIERSRFGFTQDDFVVARTRFGARGHSQQ